MSSIESGYFADVRRLILVALRNPAQVAELKTSELDLLIRLMRSVRLHGRLAADLRRAGVFEMLPQVAQDQLASALVMADARERVAAWELDRIAWAMSSEPETRLICMKGCAYMLLDLPERRGRIFADVDLLVDEDQLEAVEKALNDRGWKTKQLMPYDDHYYRRWTHELPPLVHVERDVEIDLHHNIVPRTARLKPPPGALADNARSIAGSRYLVPTDEDLVLHAMTHLMFDSDLGDKLRDLVDIDDLLRFCSARDPEFWDRFLARAPELDLTRPAYYSLRYVSSFLDSPVPDSVLAHIGPWAPPRPIRWLMDILVPRALFPAHPDFPTVLSDFCRLLLYMRSHWVRMPPWLLVYHLSYKFVVTRLGRRPRPSG